MLDPSMKIEGEFHNVSYAQWKKSVDQMLGGDLNERLIYSTLEEISLRPLEVVSIQTVDLVTFPVNCRIAKYEISQNPDCIDAVCIHNAGASIIQEVVYILHLFAKKMLTEDEIKIYVACDSLYFSNVAKLRAIRFICERLIEESNLHKNFVIIAHNSLREQTLFDPWVNMLRSTASSMAAIIGGANAISALSYDHLFSLMSGEKESTLGKRHAQNNLKIILEETKLAQVIDPAKGSYQMDNLTYQIIEKAWQQFTDDRYDLEASMEEFSKSVELSAQKRYRFARERKMTITGVNNFANPDETLESIYKKHFQINKNTHAMFPLRPIALEFESLRASLNNHKTKMQLAILGEEAKLTGRINFCKNFFEVLGINVHQSAGTMDVERLISDFKKQNCEHVIFCGQDEGYADHVKNLIKVYKDAGAKGIYLAGAPKSLDMNQLKMTGLTNAIFMGQDVYEVLNHFVKEVVA